MWWSCFDASLSQLWPRGMPPWDYFSDGYYHSRLSRLTGAKSSQDDLRRYRADIHPSDTQFIDVVERWMRVLTFYLQTTVTFDEDRPIAITGMARYLQSVSAELQEAKYHSGLWSTQILRQLLWAQPDVCAKLVDSSHWAHPLPSWTPLKCRVRITESAFRMNLIYWLPKGFGTSTVRYLARNASFRADGLDRFGQACTPQDLTLHLQGVVVDLKTITPRDVYRVHPIGYEDATAKAVWDSVSETHLVQEWNGHFQGVTVQVAYQEDYLELSGLLLTPFTHSADVRPIATCMQWTRVGVFHIKLGIRIQSGCLTPDSAKRLKVYEDAFQVLRYGIKSLADFAGVSVASQDDESYSAESNRAENNDMHTRLDSIYLV